MSHFTRLRTRFRDKEMLLQCLNQLGLQVQEHMEIRGYKGARRVEVAVKTQGYSIGFALGVGGHYDVVADWWGVKGVTQAELTKKLEREFDEMQRRIRREYALSTTLAQLQQQGFQVTEQATREDGTVKILARRWRG